MNSNKNLFSLLIDPISKESLVLHVFNTANQDGVFINNHTLRIFPLIMGVPIIIENSIPKEFYNTYKVDLLKIIEHTATLEKQVEQAPNTYSFSLEWGKFEENNDGKTWGMTPEDRVLQFYLETNTTEDSIKGLRILDAGCGNGLLTMELAKRGAIVVGIDFSKSVWSASCKLKHPNLLFVRGDLQKPPFSTETFDIIISNGVLHHTQNTRNTFVEVSKLVKQGGKFYVWLYRRPFTIYFGLFMRITDGMRLIISNLPTFLQKILVTCYAKFFYYLKVLRNRKMEYNQLIIDSYDILTPRFKHYHNPIEVAEWYFSSGFAPPTLSHWDNPYGFGIMAIKNRMSETPGLNFKIPVEKKQNGLR